MPKVKQYIPDYVREAAEEMRSRHGGKVLMSKTAIGDEIGTQNYGLIDNFCENLRGYTVGKRIKYNYMDVAREIYSYDR